MEFAAVLRSFNCAVGTVSHVQSTLEKPGVAPLCNAASNKSLFTRAPIIGGRLISSPFLARKGAFLLCGQALSAASDVSSGSNSQESLKKENLRSPTFPNGFEALILEVCDETNVAELKLKVGDFEMNLRRNIQDKSLTSPSTPPPAPSKPMVESTPATPPALLSKAVPEISGPFKNAELGKSSKLAALEASGAKGYVLVFSPTVGSFRRGRTVKGKKQPPICKEGDVIKQGQVIGYLDQFGSELPVNSDVAGEVLKLLYNEGEAVGYGDPLVAVLPSFHGIN